MPSPTEPDSAAASFAAMDWVVLSVYLVLVVGIGIWATKRRATGEDYFLAGRNMPVWAVAISLLATMQSAATFVGGPQQSYNGDLTYLASNVGGIIAAVIVATLFIPAFYRHGVTSVYELIGVKAGTGAQRTASGMFMLGRVFASGARLFIVAIPFSLVAFGDIETSHLVLSIVIISCIAGLYAMLGGIRAVIWTDVMQLIVYISCLGIALWLIWSMIPAPVGEIWSSLQQQTIGDDETTSKLTLFDWSFDLSRPFTMWANLIGVTLLMIAALGADQDMTQRMLTCRSSARASWSVIGGTLLGIPVVFVFLLMGLLLFVYYQQPELMGDAAPQYDVGDTRRVFLTFILAEMPIGVRGLMMAGLFAAAMSTMDSGLNAMSSTVVSDFYRPWRKKHDPDAQSGDAVERRVGRIACVAWAVILGSFACFCIWWQQQGDETLIEFALSVMVYAYCGLLGVFFSVLLVGRSHAAACIVTMALGFAVALATEPMLVAKVSELIGREKPLFALAFSWRLTLGAVICTSVCLTLSLLHKRT